MSEKMKILVLGHGQHGKGVVSDILHNYGVRCCDSSMFSLKEVIWPVIGHQYKDMEECYEDRRKRRELWFTLISEYNKPDRSRLARELLSEYDAYIGMRCDNEFMHSYKLFDLIIWVDRSQHQRIDPTMRIQYNRLIMEHIDNNGSLTSTQEQLVQLLIKYQWPGLQQAETGAGDTDA